MDTVLTQSHLAQRLGLPRTTVAAALNPKIASRLRPAVRERVQAAALQFGYVPHQAARSLRSGKTHTVALVSSNSLQYSYVHETVEQIRLELTRHGYHLSLDFSYEPADTQVTLGGLASGRCDGVLWFGLETWARAGLLKLRDRGLPIVVLQPWSDPDFETIATDRHQEGYLATQHLLEQGHRVIAAVVGPREPATEQSSDRVRGYADALQAFGPTASGPLVLQFEVEGDVQVLWQQIQSAQPRPSGVFVYNDELAMRLVHTIRLDGVRVPEDMALVADGNTRIGRLSELPLTCVDQNRAEVARVTVARLLERMEHPQMPRQHILLKPFLVVRESSGGEPVQSEKAERGTTEPPVMKPRFAAPSSVPSPAGPTDHTRAFCWRKQTQTKPEGAES